MYQASDLRKGLKIEIDGEPYMVTEFQFVKPGKGQAMYKCKIKNIFTGGVVDRTFRSVDKIGKPDLMEKDMKCQVLFYNNRAIDITLPNFVEKTISETEPGFKGDTSTNTYKPAKIENGYEVQVPLFINEGDVVRIDTRTGAYADRVAKG